MRAEGLCQLKGRVIALDDLESIKQMYTKFSHLDILFSDPDWMNSEDKVHTACREMWLAIKTVYALIESKAEVKG
jgi:hypothetical protein